LIQRTDQADSIVAHRAIAADFFNTITPIATKFCGAAN
jgi:hypothetical protein